jgi:hypothetical protein
VEMSEALVTRGTGEAPGTRLLYGELVNRTLRAKPAVHFVLGERIEAPFLPCVRTFTAS